MKLGQLGFNGNTIRDRTDNLGIYRPENNINIRYYNTGQIKNFVLKNLYLTLEDGGTPITAVNDMFFAPDGTKIYLLFNGISVDGLGFPSGTKRIYQLNLSTAWEISSWNSSSSINLTTSDLSLNLPGTFSNPQVESFHFDPDGTKLWILTSYLQHSSTVYSTNAVYHYSSTVAWDITYFTRSTASSGTLQLPPSTNPTQYTYPYYNSGSYNRSSERDLWIDPNGQYMRILCDEGDLQNANSFVANRDNIKEYYFSTAYDLSTAALEQTVQTGMITSDAAFSSIEYAGSSYNTNTQYLTLGGEFDKGSAGIGPSGTTTVGAVTYTTGSPPPDRFIPENYTTLEGAVDLSSDFTKINGIEMDNNGKTMQVCGLGTQICSYPLKNNWSSVINNDVSELYTGYISRCFTFSSDGTKLIIYETVVNDEFTDARISTYELSSSYDITTASLTYTYTVSESDRHPVSISINTSGTVLYLVYAHGDPNPTYDPFDYPQITYEYPNASSGQFAKFKYVQEMHMTTAWNVTTLYDPTPTPTPSFQMELSSSTYDAADIFVTADYVFLLKWCRSNNTTRRSHLYRFDNVSNWIINTSSTQFTQRLSLNHNSLGIFELASAFWFGDNGTKLYVLEWKTVSVAQWNLTSAYNLTTASYVKSSKWYRQYLPGTTTETTIHATARLTTPGNFEPRSICFDPSGDHMYIMISAALNASGTINHGWILQYDLKDTNYRWDIEYYGNAVWDPSASNWHDFSGFADLFVKANHGFGSIRWDNNGNSLYFLLEQGEIRRREKSSLGTAWNIEDLDDVDFTNVNGHASRCKSGAFFTEIYGSLDLDEDFGTRNHIRSFCFGDNGNKLYVLNHDEAKIITLDLSTAYDISSASARTYRLLLNVDSVFSTNYLDSRQIYNSPFSAHFDLSNGYIFITESITDRINKYNVLVGSASTHVENYYWEDSKDGLISPAVSSGIYLNSSGTSLSIIDNSTNLIKSYTLSSPFNLSSTFTLANTYDTSVVGDDFHDLWFEPNQNSFYFGGGTTIEDRMYRYKINSSATNFTPNLSLLKWNLNDAQTFETYSEILDIQWEYGGTALYVLTYNRLFRFKREFAFGTYSDLFRQDENPSLNLVYDSCIGYTTGVDAPTNFGTISGLPGLNSNDYFRCFYRIRSDVYMEDFYIITQTGKLIYYDFTYGPNSPLYNGFTSQSLSNTKIMDLKHIDYNIRNDINWIIYDYNLNANIGVSNGYWINYPNKRTTSIDVGGFSLTTSEVRFNFSSSQEEISGSIQKFDFKKDLPFASGNTDHGEKIIFDTSSDQLVIREIDGTLTTLLANSAKLKFSSPATTEGVPQHNLGQVFSYYGNLGINGTNINSIGISNMSSFWWHASTYEGSGMASDITFNNHDKLFVYDSAQGRLYQLEHVKS